MADLIKTLFRAKNPVGENLRSEEKSIAGKQ